MKNKIFNICLIIILLNSLLFVSGCTDKDNNNNNTKKYTVKNVDPLNADRIMADGSYQIRFSDLVSIESLKEYNNKTVTAIGYLSPIMSYDGSFGYLMNLPYQTCPYCLPSDTKITNTIAIFAKDGEIIDFTESAIIVKGTLKLEDYTDEYGYSYSYRIIDCTISLVDTSEVGEKITLYNQLAEKKIMSGILETLNAVDENVFYDIYIIQGYDVKRRKVDTTALEQVIEDLKEFDQNAVGQLVEISNNLKEVADATNNILTDKQYSEFANYTQTVEEIFESINEWMGQYEL